MDFLALADSLISGFLYGILCRQQICVKRMASPVWETVLFFLVLSSNELAESAVGIRTNCGFVCILLLSSNLQKPCPQYGWDGIAFVPFAFRLSYFQRNVCNSVGDKQSGFSVPDF